MKKSKNLLMVGFLCSTFLVPAVAGAKTVVIATSATTLTNIPFWVGIERKFFDEYGFSVQYVVMRSDLAVKGLLSGDVDYNQSGSSVVRAAAAGAPMAAIFGMFNRSFFELVAHPEIKKVSDLKGKTIAISRFGASTEYAVKYGLNANGIDSEKEVKLLAAGPESARIAAVQQKLAYAAVVQVPTNFIAEKVGLHGILALGEYLETLYAGLGTSHKKIDQEREDVKKVIRALVKSIDYMNSNPSEVRKIIHKRLGPLESNVVDYIYALVTKYVTRNGIPSSQALENSLLGTPFEGKIKSFDKLTDFSIAREVAQGK